MGVHFEKAGGKETMMADFVVDCSGRQSKIDIFLQDMAYESVPFEEVYHFFRRLILCSSDIAQSDAGIGYASAIVHPPEPGTSIMPEITSCVSSTKLLKNCTAFHNPLVHQWLPCTKRDLPCFGLSRMACHTCHLAAMVLYSGNLSYSDTYILQERTSLQFTIEYYWKSGYRRFHIMKASFEYLESGSSKPFANLFSSKKKYTHTCNVGFRIVPGERMQMASL